MPGVTDIREDWTGFFKPRLKATKVSSIATELNSSRGTFSSIAIELKLDGQRALRFENPDIAIHPEIPSHSLIHTTAHSFIQNV